MKDEWIDIYTVKDLKDVLKIAKEFTVEVTFGGQYWTRVDISKKDAAKIIYQLSDGSTPKSLKLRGGRYGKYNPKYKDLMLLNEPLYRR